MRHRGRFVCCCVQLFCSKAPAVLHTRLLQFFYEPSRYWEDDAIGTLYCSDTDMKLVPI